MKIFKRKPRQIEFVNAIGIAQAGSIKVEHVLKELPKPRPTRIIFRITNRKGEAWHVNPINIVGQRIIPVGFPLSFITGEGKDAGIQITIEGNLEYDN